MFGFMPNRRIFEMQSVLAAALTALSAQLAAINAKLEKIMHTLDETLAAVTAESTTIDGLVTLFNSVEQQLKDALAGTTLPPATQAKVDAIFDGLTNNAAKAQAAIVSGTSPAP